MSNFPKLPYLNSLLVLQNFTTARKSGKNYGDILKAFFVRHSSEFKTSDSDRKVNRNIYPDAVTCDRRRLIGPKSGQLGPIHYSYNGVVNYLSVENRNFFKRVPNGSSMIETSGDTPSL